MKKCLVCGEEKYESEFHWRVVGMARRGECKSCAKEIRKKYPKTKKYVNERQKDRMTQEEESRLFNPLITRKW